MWFNKGNVAIDLGSRTLKGLSLSKRRGRVYLDNFFLHDLMVGSPIYPQIDEVSQKLRSLIEVHSFTNAKVITCLPDTDLLNHEVALPEMPDEDLQIALRNEIEEQFDISSSELSLDFIKLKSVEVNGTQSNVYKIYCAKKEIVKKLIHTLDTSGIETKVIDSAALAQVEMLQFNGYLKAGKCYVCLEMGESHITVSLLSDGKVLNTNVIPTGLGLINRNLFNAQGMSYQEAENLKLKVDLDVEQENPDPSHQQIDEALYEIFYKIQRLIGFFKVQVRTQKLEALYVTGGGSLLTNVTKAMESYCDIETTIVNPFRNIEIFSKDNRDSEKIALSAPYMSTAVGLALRGI